MALAEDPASSKFTVQDSGEGRWTIQSAIAEAISAEVLTAALFARFRAGAGSLSRSRLDMIWIPLAS
jgi:6-phosphogluconate dehydrogenase (decarboxylating)